jgi:hypothetical protein
MFAFILAVILGVASSLAAGFQIAGGRVDPGASQKEQTPRNPDDIAPWEHFVQGAIENRGVAQIEMFESRWVLTVRCNGTHQTYLDDSALPLADYVDRFLQARYHYVERTVDVACFRPPCAPVRERRISLDKVTILSLTPEQAITAARQCN